MQNKSSDKTEKIKSGGLMMKRFMKVVACAACACMVVTGCGKGGQGGPNGGAGGPGGMPMQEQQSDATAVETALAGLSSISSEYMYSGTVEPKTTVNVLNTTNGKVTKVNYDVGDKVNKDDVLFTMDTTDIQNNINVNKANVQSANASVKSAQTNLELANGSSMQTQIENAKNSITNAKSNITTSQNSVKEAETSLNNAKISLDKAKSDYETNKKLYDAGGLSKENMDNYKDSYDKAQNAYEQAEISLEKAKTNYQSSLDSLEQAQTNYNILANQTTEENVRKAQDSLAQAQASKASSEAQLASSQKSLDDAVVKSPISGTVLECNVTEGAVANGTPFVIVDLNTVNIEVNVAEQIISSIKVGDSVKIKITTISDEIFEGNITSIAPGANSDGTYKVKVEINNSDGQLKSGMFAEIYFTKEKSDNTIVLPRSAVMSKNDEYYVFTVENNVAKKKVVEIGIDNGDEIEIKSGLKDTDLVVVKGQSYLKDGDSVNDVTNADTTNNNADNNGEDNQNQAENKNNDDKKPQDNKKED